MVLNLHVLILQGLTGNSLRATSGAYRYRCLRRLATQLRATSRASLVHELADLAEELMRALQVCLVADALISALTCRGACGMFAIERIL